MYFAPAADSLLWEAGCRWLGRDPEHDRVVDQPRVPGMLSTRISQITASPRHYGLHATLKAPFHLNQEATEEDLKAALAAFAARRPAFPVPRLEVAVLGGFLALRPAAPDAALQALAAECVTQFDRFRRPPDAHEMARRLAAGLDARQQALLAKWGYPYVLDQFRFHLTLTDRLDAPERERLQPWLDDYFAEALRQALRCEHICLYVQSDSGGFRLIERFALATA